MRARFPFLPFVAVLLAVSGMTSVARAETCPDVPDEEVALRRSMAKEWFAKAEESEAGGDRQGAVRRYACSLNLAPHPSTAYNLGTVAEKSGDLSMAIDGFRTYLKLATEATDRPAIEARIVALEAKISELRKIAPKPTVPDATPAAVVAPTTPPNLTAPPAPAPAIDEGGGHTRRTLAWTSAGVGVAALGAGILFNVLARGKMEDCHAQWSTQPQQALDLCDDAKPLAYGSYALFGAAGALGVTSAILFLTSSGRGPEETSKIALVPSLTAGGGSLLATGRF